MLTQPWRPARRPTGTAVAIRSGRFSVLTHRAARRAAPGGAASSTGLAPEQVIPAVTKGRETPVLAAAPADGHIFEAASRSCWPDSGIPAAQCHYPAARAATFRSEQESDDDCTAAGDRVQTCAL